jgi:hypothetical protein
MSNFMSQAKRKRELAKLDKRNAKDQKRAQRKAERSGTGASTPASTSASVAAPRPTGHRPALDTAPVRKPLTLSEAAEKWKNAKIVKPPQKR